MTEQEFQRNVIASLEGLTSKVDRLVDAVDGNPEHGVPGLMERMAVIEDRTPGKVKRAGISAISGVIGGALTLAAAFLKGMPGN